MACDSANGARRRRSKDAVAPKVLAVVEQALIALGAETDPECWVAWGDDPAIRYLLLVPTPSGLLQVNVRVAVPGEGPRAAGKVSAGAASSWASWGSRSRAVTGWSPSRSRTWSSTAPMRSADAISAFAQALFAAVDGRLVGALDAGEAGGRARSPGRAGPPAASRRRRAEGIVALTAAEHDRASLPGPSISPVRRTIRYWVSRLVAGALTRAYLRVRLDGRERLPAGPAIYCFNHLSWADPFVLMAVLPFRPRLWFFGPKEEDMRVGGRNRLMSWTGTTIPYKPGKNDLLDATRRVAAVVGSGAVIAIAGEGRIHARESELLPLSEGAAYFALRSGVPLVPIAIRRHELAAVRGPGPGPGRGAHRDLRPADTRGRRRGLTARILDGAPGSGRRRPRPPTARAVRALGHRAVQRLAGRLAGGRVPRPSAASGLAYFEPPETT